MNAIFLCTLYALLVAALGQRLNNANFLADGDVDYQDFQISSQAPPQAPQRSARPRSPAIASASEAKATPIPILKQINRHNEDGSYTYGFEGADGSFKIETKLATGEVIGKYGYVDDSGKVRTVEYGANKYGFQPSGEGITIPPINIGNDTESNERPAEDDGQFVPEPVRPAKPPSPKRKPQRPPQQFFVPEQRPVPQQFVAEQRPVPQQFVAEQRPVPQQAFVPEQRPVPQQPYFVHEQDEIQIRPQPQRQFAPTPTDINSLQFALENELRDAPSFPFRVNEIPQRKVFQPTPEEEPVPRPFPQSLTIPSAFDAQPQFIPQPNDFSQQFDVSSPKVANTFRAPVPPRSQSRQKPKPQVLFLTSEDAPQPNAIRRNSVSQENRSILDELLKQYSIPNGSPAINDFSFSQNA